MHIVVRFMFERGDSYIFRRTVPEDVRAYAGVREWKKSLGPVSKHEAIAQIRVLTAETNQQIEHWRSPARMSEHMGPDGQELLEDQIFNRAIAQQGLLTLAKHHNDDRYAVIDAYATPKEAAVLAGELTLSDALERDDRNYPGKDPKPREQALRVFMEANGDLPMSQINRSSVHKFVNLQRERELSERTILRRMQALGGVMTRYIADEELVRTNPFSKFQLKGAKASAASVEPFSDEDVRQFDAYLASSCQTSRTRPRTISLLWAIRCGGGMGASEVSGLLPEDIIADAEIPHIWVRPNRLRGLKADCRERLIPIVGPLGRHLEHLPNTSNKFCANAAAGRLKEAIKKAMPDNGESRGSNRFRHWWKDAYERAEVRPDLRRYLMGHSRADNHARYGRSVPDLNELKAALLASGRFTDLGSK
ncbi:MAG: DUF6538 domain-containing protein [Pseudomonadota bacterium]